MTWRSFLFATRALMDEEGLAFAQPEAEASAPAPAPADVRERNAAALAEVQAMMASVQGAPKGPRRTRR